MHSTIGALAVFMVSAVVVWYAGVRLSISTDVLSDRLGWGQAVGGLVFLGIVTNLPELAIVATGALHHDLKVAVGDILGDISNQVLVLVVVDVVCLGTAAALSYKAASLTLVIEGLVAIAILMVVIIGTQLPADVIWLRMTPPTVLIAALWVFGLWLVVKSRHGLRWHHDGVAPGGQRSKRGSSKRIRLQMANAHARSTWRVVSAFTAASIATLVAGYYLERTSESLAKDFGMQGVVFGATFLSWATTIPGVSSAMAATRLGDYQLAVSDILGGNAFLPVLFLLGTLLSGQAVLPQAGKADIYLVALGILLMCAYLAGLILRPRKQVWRLGLDSLAVLVLYAVGIAGLFLVGGGQA